MFCIKFYCHIYYAKDVLYSNMKQKIWLQIEPQVSYRERLSGKGLPSHVTSIFVLMPNSPSVCINWHKRSLTKKVLR